MHRKKFLSFLGMAALAAPLLANELPKQEEVKPLELKKAALDGFAEPIKSIDLTTSSIAMVGHQLMVWDGKAWQEQNYPEPIPGFYVYRTKYTSGFVSFTATPYE
jgi:hypothetical protein